MATSLSSNLRCVRWPQRNWVPGRKVDVLTVSYSANDYVGHRYGPDSAGGSRCGAARRSVDWRICCMPPKPRPAPGNVLAVLTADHGVAPLPEENQKRKMPGGRVDFDRRARTLESSADGKFGGCIGFLFARKRAST